MYSQIAPIKNQYLTNNDIPLKVFLMNVALGFHVTNQYCFAAGVIIKTFRLWVIKEKTCFDKMPAIELYDQFYLKPI